MSYWRLRRKVCEAVILRGNIYQSEKVGSPFVLGIIRPKIYLPYHMDSREMDHVIAHEQTHIRRRDHWWKPLGFLLLTIHWFNPLMWLSYVLLCRDIELACDEKVIREMGNEQRADYTQALVACSVGRRVIAACPLAFGEVGVKERVKSVMNYKKPAFWIVLASVIVCAAAAVCFLTNPKSEGSNDITELLAPGSAWSYQLGYDADFPVDASFTVQDDLSVVGTIVKNDTNTDFCIRYRVRGTAGWAEFYGCTPEMAQEAGSEKYLLFTASLRADNGKLVFRMSDGYGLSCFGTREATFTQIADTSSAHTEPWFDYLEKPEEMNWDGNLEIELPEYPGVTFRWYPEKMDAVAGSEVTQLYTGMPIWNTYFCDLTGDGLPDLCSTLTFGSGMIDSRIIVYDYANGASYMLEDRGKYDYSLRLNETDGCLWVVKKAYNSDDLISSGHILFKDGCIQIENTNASLPQMLFDDYPIYDSIVFDVDGDGIDEVCVLGFGRTSGLFTFTFRAAEIGADTLKYDTLFCTEWYDLSFIRGDDGVVRVQGIDQKEPPQTHLFDIAVVDGSIQLTEDGQSISRY